MSDFLAEMTIGSRKRAEEAKRRLPEYRSKSRSMPPPRLLEFDGFGVVAEAKIASPTVGRLGAGAGTAEVVDLARRFVAGGATAISVLTVPDRFEGAIEHLSAVASVVDVPVMRKDFLVEPCQVVEARAYGASGVLLIARILGETRLLEMVDTAAELGLFILVELFDEEDLEIALSVLDRDILIGVNARDLADLSLDRGRFARMAPVLPDKTKVAESGIDGPHDVRDVARLGYELALVGTSLVRSDKPTEVVAQLTSEGRRVMAGAN